jgi:M6 family metalloprotease-like protein
MRLYLILLNIYSKLSLIFELLEGKNMLQNLIISLFILLFTLSCGGSSDGSQETPEDTPLEQIKSPMHKPSIPLVVFLISFDDISISTTSEQWRQKIFGNNFHDLNDYFKQTSQGQFQLLAAQETQGVANDGIIEIKLNKNHPNQSISSPLFMQLVYPYLIDVLNSSDQFIDYNNYDTNGDGAISFDELAVSFVFAGYEDAYEGYHIQQGVWAHSSCLSSSIGVVSLDGVSLIGCDDNAKFTIFGELHNQYQTHIATNGLIAHEFGHAIFGLPDLYNTYNANSGGIGYFGLMGAGIWTKEDESEFAGETPSHFSAWSKIYNRWIEPVTQTGSTTLQESSSILYNIIKIPIDTNHYYLLENRNNQGYDKGLWSLKGDFNGGIAIWKINEEKLREQNFSANDVNTNTEDKGVDIVEAIDGDIDTTGGGGDQNALYYEENKDYFLNLVDTISPRAATMTLNIKDPQ